MTKWLHCNVHDIDYPIYDDCPYCYIPTSEPTNIMDALKKQYPDMEIEEIDGGINVYFRRVIFQIDLNFFDKIKEKYGCLGFIKVSRAKSGDLIYRLHSFGWKDK